MIRATGIGLLLATFLLAGCGTDDGFQPLADGIERPGDAIVAPEPG